MSNKELLKEIKNYISEGIEQSVDIFKTGELLAGKLAAYNDIYDYIENVLEVKIKEEEV